MPSQPGIAALVMTRSEPAGAPDYDQAVRELVPRHGGREIDRAGGFFLLFDAVAAAVAFAEALQGALHGRSVQAGIGVHWGEVVLTPTPHEHLDRGAKPLEVDGLAKSVTARVMSVAQGGQTLLTADAAAMVPSTGGRVVLSHGHWHLKGLEDPVELFEVGRSGRAPLLPPSDAAKVWRMARRGDDWVAARELPRALVAERDSFHGRGDVLRAVASHLGDGALVVELVGESGTGKTRVANRFAADWLARFPGGAWYVDLASARSGAEAVQAWADVVREGVAGGGECLLLLDHVELPPEEVDEVVAAWQGAAPQGRCLIIGRILPARRRPQVALGPLQRAEAIALFRARAAATLSDVEGSTDEAAVGDICDLLDRRPAAIEVAALRVRLMPPSQLLARMRQERIDAIPQVPTARERPHAATTVEEPERWPGSSPTSWAAPSSWRGWETCTPRRGGRTTISERAGCSPTLRATRSSAPTDSC